MFLTRAPNRRITEVILFVPSRERYRRVGLPTRKAAGSFVPFQGQRIDRKYKVFQAKGSSEGLVFFTPLGQAVKRTTQNVN